MADKEKKFEEALAELEQVISEVGNGSMPLEKMIDKITEGVKLIRFCQKRLDALNSKVEILFNDDGAGGEFTEFDSATDRARAAGAAAPAPGKKSVQNADNPNQDQLPF